MTAIADRAGSSIGALYSYFPDKKALAMALLDIYAAKIEQHWKSTVAPTSLARSRAQLIRSCPRQGIPPRPLPHRLAIRPRPLHCPVHPPWRAYNACPW